MKRKLLLEHHSFHCSPAIQTLVRITNHYFNAVINHVTVYDLASKYDAPHYRSGLNEHYEHTRDSLEGSDVFICNLEQRHISIHDMKTGECHNTCMMSERDLLVIDWETNQRCKFGVVERDPNIDNKWGSCMIVMRTVKTFVKRETLLSSSSSSE